jgi:hypothetical protein
MSREIIPREIVKTYHKPSVIVGAATDSPPPNTTGMGTYVKFGLAAGAIYIAYRYSQGL